MAGDARTNKGAVRDINDINNIFESQLRLAAKEASAEGIGVYDTGAVWHGDLLYDVV